jgi:hypothetical protein
MQGLSTANPTNQPTTQPTNRPTPPTNQLVEPPASTNDSKQATSKQTLAHYQSLPSPFTPFTNTHPPNNNHV